MRKVIVFWALLISIGAAAQTVRQPLSGSVHNVHFNFTHSSAWKAHEIVNFVRNDHADDLVVYWLEGGVIRPIENPLKGKDVDSNSSPCPEDKLNTNDKAILSYGLSDNRKTAPVYTTQSAKPTFTAQMPYTPQQNDSSPAEPEPMTSEISTSIKGEPVKFEVTSERVRNEYVEYYFVFAQGKPTYFALNIQPQLFKYFGDAKVSVQPGASETLQFGNLPLRE